MSASHEREVQATRSPQSGTWATLRGTARIAELERDAAELKQAERALIEQRERIDALTKALAERDAKLADLKRAIATHLEQRARVDALEAELEKREARAKSADGSRGRAWEVREAALRNRLAERYEKRYAELEQRFETRRGELEAQLDETEERLGIREAELREEALQREGALKDQIEELKAALGEAQRRAIAKPLRNGKLKLNEATFEQLRDLGLSVTLSARVISYRDSRCGFESLDELDEIPGLPIELKRVLRGQLQTG
jgi:DNA uptake protein ComE-like DNA-binding protein